VSRGAGDGIDIVTHKAGPREVVAIGIPSFGMVHLYFCARLYNLRHPMNRIVRQIYLVGKEVGEARNEICARALAIGEDDPSLACTKLLFLDDDLLFHPDLLLKLLADDKPIVSGLYYTKTTVPTPLVLHDEYQGTAKKWVPGDLVECAAHGMGLCLMDTEILRRLRDETDLGTDRHGYPNWFQTTRDLAVLTPDGTPAVHNSTEDVHFLKRVRALGYQPVVDTSAAAFAWHLDTKTQQLYPQRQWTEFAQTGKITWTDTPAGPVVWEDAA
jgi:hypothetical protein